MQYRTDPESGVRVSALGLGCMRLPGAQRGRILTTSLERLRTDRADYYLVHSLTTGFSAAWDGDWTRGPTFHPSASVIPAPGRARRSAASRRCVRTPC